MSNIDWSQKTTAAAKQEQAALRRIANFKADRKRSLDTAVVVTASGKQFDADEKSIGRIGFRLQSVQNLPDNYRVGWVLADSPAGHKTPVSKAELQEAFDLAVANMDAIWEFREV